MESKYILLMFFVFILSMGIVSANENIDANVTSVQNEHLMEMASDLDVSSLNDEVSINEKNLDELDVLEVSSQDSLKSNDEVIVVNNWDELQYYCSLTDKDYTLKLKDNTNFYPTDPSNRNYQITINNNVKIIGGNGSYFGDSCQRNAYVSEKGRYVVEDGDPIVYTPIIVPDGNRMGLTLENITFKWIYTLYHRDGVFLQMGGNAKNVIKNCVFKDISTMIGHSCIVYLKKGDALLENCSFINCTTDFGCVSLYDPNSYISARMTVKDCYFENNFARTEPGCINNCAILTVYNTTFYKNRAGVWAGAIHTHFHASATIYDSNFTDNLAGWNGGALYTYSDLKIYNTIFSGNNCTTNNGGGAIGACKHVSPPHIYIENSLFENNQNLCWALDELSTDGTGRGGAISLMDEGSLEVRNTTFISNAASIGTAICAIEAGSYGSPDVIIVNNTFINHTRAGDVIYVRVKDTLCNISDNYYFGNSIEFSNLTLTKLNEGKEYSTLQIAVDLKNPSYYDSNILDKTFYDVYVNGKYVKTVNSTIFTLDFGDLDICNVYVIPTISNRKSNEVTLTSTREYIFVSKNGSDSNSGISRETPVRTIQKALDLARNCQNIIILDGDYSENLEINYDVTLKGEGNATLTDKMSLNVNANFTLKNLKINNLNTDAFIKQNSNNLFISNCIITNNNALLVHNNGFTTIVDSILLNNSNVLQGNGNYVLDYNWWGNSAPDLNINKYAILNITSDVEALENNQKANVKAVFYLNDGSKYTKLPEINLDVTAVKGIVNKNITNIDSNVIYTLTAFSDGILTINYNDFTLNKTFEFLKSNPSISITADDIMFGDNLTITVNLPNDVEGNLTVNVGNISQTKGIESPKTVFTFTNLKSGTYEIFTNYSGDKKYQSKTTTANVNVDKYQSTTNLNISTINVGDDVILTITTTNSSTGTITLSINNNTQTLTLNNSKANYTIKNIKRGDYLITAVYNGDDKYLTSRDSKFIEVDNLNATMTIQAEDITYGETTIIKASLNDDATGEVFVTIDGITNSSKVINGKADIAFFNLDAGLNKNISVFYSGDDTYFNKTGSANFTINKAELTFDISSESVKIGQDIVIHIKVPAKTSGTFTINEETMNIPLSGVISYVLSDLEIGNYTYTATYNGNNYNTVSKDTSFEVSEYPTPQWANEGGNIQNTHKSPYETTTNGEIAFTIPFNQTLNGEMLIDSEGNLYLTTQEGVYCFNQTNQLWNFTSTDVMGNFSGICIGRDVIAAPKSGDTLYFINQSNGEKYGSSNIYQGSSIFAPVIDSDANLYITSEYQYSSQDYKLTIVPYKLWETGSNPTLITIGNTQPLCSPTLDENIIVIVSDNRLRMIDAKTLQTISIKQGNYLPVRPVIGEGSVVYTVLSDSIVAYNVNGVQVWKTKVIGGVGNTLAIDTEHAVYHINAKGLLYKYDIIDGAQSKVSNLKVTSGLLIGSDGTLYFGSNNIFYAMDSEGNILWKSDLKSKIIGNPVMDKNGLIYTVTEDGIVALTYAPLKDPNIIINVSDVYIGEDVVVNVAIDNQILGDFSIVFNGETYKNTYTKVFSNLEVGEYSVDVVFDGDTRFMAKTVTANFTVSKYDSNLTVSTSNIFVGESLVFDINIAGDATGNIILNLNNQNYTAKDNKIIIDNLPANTYNYNLIYSGDGKYESKTLIGSVSVSKIESNLTVSTSNIFVGESLVFDINIAGDATGNIILNLNNQNYTAKDNKIIIDNLPANTYNYNLVYSGDDKYNSNTLIGSVSVSKADTDLVVNVEDIYVGDDAVVNVKMPSNVVGNVTTTVNGKNYSAVVINGVSKIIIPDLKADNYTITVYFTSYKYIDCVNTTAFTVSKVKIIENVLNVTGAVFTLSLPPDATGTLTVNVNNKNYTQNVIDGKSIVGISDLNPGIYTAHISYSGDDKYESIIFDDVILNIDKLPSSIHVNAAKINVGDNATINITTSVIAGKATVTVNNRDYNVTVNNYMSQLSISGLGAGNYTVITKYMGDDTYSPSINTTTFTVSKVKLDEDVLSVNNTVFTIDLPSDAEGILIVNVNDKNYTQGVTEGRTIVNITDLNPGTYTAHITYSGDDKYESIIFNDAIVNIDKLLFTISVSVADINVGDTALVNITTSTVSCKVVVTVNKKDYNITVDNCIAQLPISNLSEGNYTVVVRFLGDDTYGPSINTTSFVVSKVKLKEDVLSVDGTVFTINLPFNATGALIVSIDKNYTQNVVNGKAVVNVTDLNPGTYTAHIAYSGDDKYESINFKDVIVNIDKLPSSISVSVADINVGDTALVNITTSISSGKVTVTVNKRDYNVTVTNYIGQLTISDLAEGNYNVTARYLGDDTYADSVNTTVFSVLKVEVPIDNETVTVPDSADTTTYSINLPEDAAGTLTVSVDGVPYTATLINGKATVNIPELTVGSHNITVSYSGDAKYSPIVRSVVVNKTAPEHVPVIKLTGSNLNMLYTSGKYFKVRLTSDGNALAGKTVKITINGKSYSRNTDKNGYASLKISLPPKTYKVKATYGSLTVNRKVVVKSIVQAKNVNAKKSAKTVKIKVTLKKVNGKYLKNKKVTLKFNKKTFKAKTNKKGVATFTIKNSVYKKLKVNKKYTYQVIYAKNKVKKTIKFKK